MENCLTEPYFLLFCSPPYPSCNSICSLLPPPFFKIYFYIGIQFYNSTMKVKCQRKSKTFSLSSLSLHWLVDSTISIELPSVISWKRETCSELQDSALQDAWQKTAAPSDGRKLIPKIWLLRGAVVEFYATETHGGTSVSFTFGIVL